MSDSTHKVLKLKDARRPFGPLTFVIDQIHKSVRDEMENVFEGSLKECDDFVLKQIGASRRETPSSSQYPTHPGGKKKTKKKKKAKGAKPSPKKDKYPPSTSDGN